MSKLFELSKLFEPIALSPLTVLNRVWLAPMCQYPATVAVPDDLRLMHHGARAQMSGSMACCGPPCTHAGFVVVIRNGAATVRSSTSPSHAQDDARHGQT